MSKPLVLPHLYSNNYTTQNVGHSAMLADSRRPSPIILPMAASSSLYHVCCLSLKHWRPQATLSGHTIEFAKYGLKSLLVLVITELAVSNEFGSRILIRSRAYGTVDARLSAISDRSVLHATQSDSRAIVGDCWNRLADSRTRSSMFLTIILVARYSLKMAACSGCEKLYTAEE